jgi:hypothetical protein
MPTTLEDLKKRLVNDFTYHAPKEGQTGRYEMIRETALNFALLIAELTPQSREQSLAFTSLETACMQANAAIARNE